MQWLVTFTSGLLEKSTVCCVRVRARRSVVLLTLQARLESE